MADIRGCNCIVIHRRGVTAAPYLQFERAIMALDKSGLFKALELKSEQVDLGEGQEVIVSQIGAADWIKLWTAPENQTNGEIDMPRFTASLIAYSLVDDTGQRLLTDDDIPQIARAPHGPFAKLAEVARRLNGMGSDEIKN